LARAVVIATIGYSSGTAIGGFISSWLIPQFGWQSVFVCCATFTLFVAAIVAAAMPETVRYAVLTSTPPTEIGAMLRRLVPGFRAPNSADFVTTEERHNRGAIGPLFRGGRTGFIVQLWSVAFLLNIDLWIMHQWLPTLTRDMGQSIAVAVRTGALFQFGSMVGGLVLGTLVDRRLNPWLPLSIAFAASGVAFFGLGQFVAAGPPFFVVVFLAGALLGGAQLAFNGVVGHTFPTPMRTTGMSFTAGISRLGAMTGPLLVGLLLGAGGSPSLVYALGAIPVFICVGLTGLLALRSSPGAPPLSNAEVPRG
jgi:MFS transporter, AAHS family, 4-hydroxybenzoate transporter